MSAFQDLVDGAIYAARNDPAEMERLLGVRFTKTEERDTCEFHVARPNSGPFSEVSYRWDHADFWGLLVLRPSDRRPQKGEIALDRYGEVVTTSVDAEVWPSGAEDFVYDVAGVKVGWSFRSGDTTVNRVFVEYPPVKR